MTIPDVSTDFQINEMCTRKWSQQEIESFSFLIDQNYAWVPILDKVPAALTFDGNVNYNLKVPLGYRKGDS